MSVSSVASAPSLSELPFPPKFDMLTSEVLGARDFEGSGWSRSSAIDRPTSLPGSHPGSVTNPHNSVTSDHIEPHKGREPPCTPSGSWKDGSHDLDGLDNWVGAQLYAELLDELDVLRATGAKFLSTAMKLVVAHEGDGATRTNTIDERVMEQLSHVDSYVRTAYHALTRRDRHMSKALRAACHEDINRSLRDLREKLVSTCTRVSNVATRNAEDRRDIKRLELEGSTNSGGKAPYHADSKHWEIATSSPCANTVVNHGVGLLLPITDDRFSQDRDHSFNGEAAHASLVVNSEEQLVLGENYHSPFGHAPTPVIAPTSTTVTPPASTTVTPPASTPVTAPASTPVTAPATTPVASSARTPVTSPARMPVIPFTSTQAISPVSSFATSPGANTCGPQAKSRLVRLASQLRKEVAATTPLRLVLSIVLGLLFLFLFYYLLHSSEGTKLALIAIHPIWEKARARKSAP